MPGKGRLNNLMVLAVVSAVLVLPGISLAQDEENTTPCYIAVVFTNAEDFFEPTYYVGEVAEFTIYIFNRDVLTDPDNLTVTHIIDFWFETEEHNLTVSRVSEGVYQGSISLDNESYEWTEHEVFVEATVDGWNVTGYGTFYVYSLMEEDLSLELTSPISEIDAVAPGDDVKLILRLSLSLSTFPALKPSGPGRRCKAHSEVNPGRGALRHRPRFRGHLGEPLQPL